MASNIGRNAKDNMKVKAAAAYVSGPDRTSRSMDMASNFKDAAQDKVSKVYGYGSNQADHVLRMASDKPSEAKAKKLMGLPRRELHKPQKMQENR